MGGQKKRSYKEIFESCKYYKAEIKRHTGKAQKKKRKRKISKNSRARNRE